MSTTANDPNTRDHETDSAHDALEVRVLWGSELLSVSHLSPPRPFIVGDGPGVDFTMPSSALGAPQLELPLHDGTTLAGGLAFHVRNVQSAVRVGSAPPSLREFVRDNAWLVVSLGAHLALLALFALLPPRASAVSLQDLRRDDRYLSFVMIPDEFLLDETPAPTPAAPEAGEKGAAHAGDNGAMGEQKAPRRDTRSGVKGKPDEQDPLLARERSLQEAQHAGILGLLAAAAPKYEGPASIFGAQFAAGRDLQDAFGNLDGRSIASAMGNGGLGLAIGTGRGAGGSAQGTIGGSIHTRGGFGSGPGGSGVGLPGRRLVRDSSVPRKLRIGPVDVAGGLSKETIRRRIRLQLPQVRHCYEQTLRGRPELQGRVSIKFIIGATGQVLFASPTGSTLSHPPTEACIASAIKRIPFPQPEGGGVVKVTYPFVFSRM